jgi:hypothetical protein
MATRKKPKKMNRPARIARSDADLKVASTHLHYELRMLRWLALKFADGGLPDEQRCAYLESFVVHARNLFDFLWPMKARETDMIAADFAHGTSWTAPAIPSVLSSIEGGKGLSWFAAKYSAHLTYDRRPPGRELEWPAGAVAQELDRQVTAFVAAVSASHPLRLDDVWRAAPSEDVRRLYAGLVPSATAFTGAFSFTGPSLSRRLPDQE